MPEDWPSVIAQIPRSCTCAWERQPPAPNWHLADIRPGCPWHYTDLERSMTGE